MARDSGLDGIILVDKPEGWTSHDVVARVRRITGQRRAGHTGTLDPFATGLLVVCLGRATRLVPLLTDHDKSYTGEIQLGVTTDSDDSTGRVIAEASVPALTPARFESLEHRFTGQLLQRPPAYSAVHVDGRRAYALARAGASVELPAREVEVQSLRLWEANPGRLGVALRCGPGTYVRSLARDIGQELGCGAHLAALRRLSVGKAQVDEAVDLDGLVRAAEAGALGTALLPVDDPLIDLPAAILGPSHSRRLAGGEAVKVEHAAASSVPLIRAYSSIGDFLALGAVGTDGILRPTRVFTRQQVPESLTAERPPI